MPPDHKEAGEIHTQSLDFMLGKIMAILEGQPARMDRFEATTTQQLNSLQAQITNTVAPINSRLSELEKIQAAMKASQAKQAGIIGTAGALVGAGLSGFITKLWH
jgi:hypothetical protein